ncbi:hypothetical protein [Sporisorium scitamineum]|uniref:Uncharacterized protein n=1 Tax=Sporisorium scitamineum TaxID=49012 RepID=A0A0F7RSS3_9BASI|nr:hypothetical protein [Sporisorium scitamineum]
MLALAADGFEGASMDADGGGFNPAVPRIMPGEGMDGSAQQGAGDVGSLDTPQGRSQGPTGMVQPGSQLEEEDLLIHASTYKRDHANPIPGKKQEPRRKQSWAKDQAAMPGKYSDRTFGQKNQSGHASCRTSTGASKRL